MSLVVRAAVALLNLLPERAALAVGRAAGVIAYALGVRRRVALDNLATAFPSKTAAEREAIARAAYSHLGVGAVEFLRAARLADGELLGRIRPDGWEIYQREHAAGRGVIVAIAHVGNFELFAAYCVRRGVRLRVLTRQLRGAANAVWLAQRAGTGLIEVPERGSTATMLRALRAGETLAIVIDQNMLPRRAVFAPFFGRLAATTPAPAVLAARTGAPILLAVLVRDGAGSHRTIIEGPFEVARGERPVDAMGRLNRALERIVAAHPEQWFWVHRRWKTRPPGEAG